MARIASFAYGLLCYALFFACFLYSIAFVGNFDVVPKTLDAGREGSLGTALAVNLALLAVFAVQHSVMARPAFKRWWTRFVPEPVERATYVLLSSAALALLYWQWQPIGGVLWDVRDPAGRTALQGLYLGGWGLLLYSTCLIDHFDLFGVRQVWLHLRGRPYTGKPFRTPSLYRHVRHPLYLSWFTIFWATPTMSAGHLLLAVGTTAYIVVAVFLEERDLEAHFGDVYRRYAATTPKYFPRFLRRRRAPAVAAEPS